MPKYQIITAIREHLHQTIMRLKRFGKYNKLNGLHWKELRDEGRR
jgi:hypothetical protein